MISPRALLFAIAAIAAGTRSYADEKTLIDYFLPTPIQGSLVSNVWGAQGVFPRDPQNGLEDKTVKQWYYWDGQIIKGSDGKYHMFASRWDQAKGHRGWGSSCAVHAVSDNAIGPYIDKGLCWPENQGGKGHNVTALVLPDGRYAVVVSETRPGDVFISKSLNGPWEHLGKITVASNEFSRLGRMSNVSIMVRPDGDFMIVPRSGAILISKNGILGPYVVQGPSIYPTAAGLPLRNLEDPVVWYSGGLYHIVVNSWSSRKAYHLTSVDGIKNWTFRGLAYDPTKDFVRYTDGTVNHWHKMERPGVLIENGHVTHFTFAVLDIPKEDQHGNDTHGSKVIVVPFDGVALDRDLQNRADKASDAATPRQPASSDSLARGSLPAKFAEQSAKASLRPPLAGKLAPRPLYRDPPFDAPTDPVLCFNAEAKKWYMYYTARRATAADARGVSWVHGTNIGMAESADGGATWTYKGTADISYGKDRHPHDYTYWAPEVIWADGRYHMFLSYVPGIFNDWNHPREIVHLTSADGVKWDSVGKIDLKSDRTIDPCVMQTPGGIWRMWYKDERARRTLCYADSPDLMKWEAKGSCVKEFNGEGPKVFHWKGKYWLIADCWRNGMRVWRSDDCLNWIMQDKTLLGSHGDVVVSGDRAWWFYFGAGRRTAINVVELSVVDGKLLPGDPYQPTYIDLKPEPEQER
jgi:hypothetical protein